MAEKKPFEPTEQRKRRARQDGKVLKSQHLTQAMVCGACLITILVWARVYWLDGRMLLEYLWTRGLTNPILSLKIVLREVFLVCGTTLGVGACVAVLVDFLQVGLRFEWGILSPRPERLNPARLPQKVREGVQSFWQVVVKSLFVGVVLSTFVWGSLEGLPTMILSGDHGVGEIWRILKGACMWGVTALVIVGVLDLFLKRREYLTELSMSHDEMRRESKDEEGDPLVKSMRRSLHEQLLMQDLVKRVRKARVVVVEPHA